MIYGNKLALYCVIFPDCSLRYSPHLLPSLPLFFPSYPDPPPLTDQLDGGIINFYVRVGSDTRRAHVAGNNWKPVQVRQIAGFDLRGA